MTTDDLKKAVDDYIGAVKGGDFAKWDRHIAAGLSEFPVDFGTLTDMVVRPLAALMLRVKALEETRGDDLVVRQELRDGLAQVSEIKDAGVWRGGASYKTGNFVTHQGCLWAAQVPNWNERPGDGGSWRMVAKSGRDGKDAPR